MKKLSIVFLGSIFAIVNCGQAQYFWTQKASLTALSGREGAAGFSLNHYGYIGGGKISSGWADDFWRWNQDSNTWSALANYPGTGRYGISGFTVAGNGYFCLGLSGSGSSTDLWEYDTATNTWAQKANFPGVARSGAFSFVIGTKAYIGCGTPNGSPYFQDVWVYDAVANTWTQVANFPGGDRTGLYAFSMNGYGYAGGGGNDVVFFNDLWQYDPITNIWKSMDSLPISGSQIGSPVCFVIDSLAFVGSGKTSSGQFTRDFWSYSAITNLWTPIATYPGVGRWNGVGFSIGNKGYAGTGLDSANNDLTDYWQYGPVPTSINEIKSNETDITIYPNPSNGIFNLIYSKIVGESTQLIITDALGRIISEYPIYGKQGKMIIDERLLSNGIYFYSVNSDNGLLTSGKFILEK